ncbi:MAG: AMP-binding protein [Candidatus Acidiferrales bacterium]
MARQSLIEFIEEYGRRGGEIAVAHRRGYRMERWTYARVAETARGFAAELASRGIAPGDRVLLWGDNCAEWVAAFFGCVLRGAVVAPLDRVATAAFAGRVAQTVEAKLLICSRGVPEFDARMPAIALEDIEAVASRHANADTSGAARTAARGDAVEIVFTSGTTAEPRGVVLTHGNILANIEPLETQMQEYLRYEKFVHPLRFLNLLPLSHVFGQLMSMFIPPLLGGTVIFLDTLSPAEVARTVRRERVTALVSVPRLIESLQGQVEREVEAAGRLEKFRANFAAADGEHFLKRCWRFRRIHGQLGWKFWAFISGGAALPETVETFWRRLGYAVIQGYGLTETTSLVSVNHPFRTGRGSIGKAMPGMEIKLSAEGEILVRGENVASGYWQGRTPDAMADAEGWFRTGDLGEMDAEGNLFFKGRRKNVIVTPAGMNVYPEDLEGALRRQAGVRDCVVVGIERDGNAEACAALLLENPGANPAAIVDAANQTLAEYQKMRRWIVWQEPDFPRTATQKPLLPQIREAVARQLGTAATTTAGDEKSSGVADFIARVTRRGNSRVAADADLERDLQLSSLDRVELMSALEEKYQVDLGETRFAEAKTVGELERLVREPPARPQTYRFPRWAQRWPVTWIRLGIYYLLVWPATWLLAKPVICGRENLRGIRGPVLVVANHVTYVDIGCVLAALPAFFRHRLATAMEAERLYGMRYPPAEMNFFMRMVNRMNYFLVIALFNVFPLPKQSGFRESFAFAGELADGGWSVLVFPEGARTKDGKLAKFRGGIGLLATRLHLPVVPVRIDGLWELAQARLAGKSSRLKPVPRGAVKVTIGAPVTFAADADAEEIARELERRVAEL